jgi:hypothetical protein
VAGATSSGERLPDWRQLDLARISAPELLDGTFETAPGFRLGADKYATDLIAHVSAAPSSRPDRSTPVRRHG